MWSNSLSGYPFCIDFITSTLIVDCKILLASPPSSKLSEKSHLVYILSVFYFSHSTTSTESSCTHTQTKIIYLHHSNIAQIQFFSHVMVSSVISSRQTYAWYSAWKLKRRNKHHSALLSRLFLFVASFLFNLFFWNFCGSFENWFWCLYMPNLKLNK